MSIYSNGAVSERKTTAQKSKMIRDSRLNKRNTSNQTKSANVKLIRNDKELTSIVKEFDKKIGAVKEVLYDHNKEIIGLLLRSGEPHFFSESESKRFLKFLGT